DFLCSAGLIFVCIVEKSGFGNDLDGRQSFPVDNTAGKLPSADIFLNDNFIFVAEGFLQCFSVLLAGFYDVHADTGTAGTWFYDYGQRKAKRIKGMIRIVFAQRSAFWSVDAGL